MMKKFFALLIVFSIMMMPIASISAMTADAPKTAPKAVRITLPANVKIKNFTKTNLSLNIAEFNLASNSKRTNLGNINFTKLDSGGVSIRLRTESGKELEMRVNSSTNGKYSLKMESGQKTANTEFLDISQLANSLPVNEFSKNLAKDSEISKLILESSKSLDVSSTSLNSKCFDDSCGAAITICVLAIVGFGLSITGFVLCGPTWGLGCTLVALGGFTVTTAGGAKACAEDVQRSCANKSEAETGVSVADGHIFIAWEPVILDDPDQTEIDCSDPLVHCAPQTIRPIKPVTME